jgi:protein CpxP
MNRRSLALAAIAAVGLAGAAWAQSPPAGGPVGGPPGGPGLDRAAMQARMCAEAPARAAARLAYAEVKLGITDAQRAAWQAFANDARAAMKPMQALCADRPAAADADAAAIFARREKAMTAALETTRAMRAASEKLTPVLNEEQKKQFAQLVAHGMGRMGGHGMHHHGMRHGAPAGGAPAHGDHKGPPPPR